MTPILMQAAEHARDYLTQVNARSVAPTPDAVERLKRLRITLPEQPRDASEVLSLLHEVGSPATVASAGGRYFGFVIGGALPVSVAANWLAAAWDQNAAFRVMSPVAAELEEVAAQWLIDLLHLPQGSATAFVTGATMANFTCLAAARRAVLLKAGWDVDADGLFGAPPITVVVGEEVHISMLKALGMLGLGKKRVVRVKVDDQGRIRDDGIPPLSGPTIICLQAGNVNTGSFDPAEPICRLARQHGAWVHVDGAFGLWARAAPGRAPLALGFELADSWAVDAHKWLNVPYDSGLAFVRDAGALQGAMAAAADYLQLSGEREPCHFTPEFSRRARAVDLWAALHHLGRSGVAEMVERCCRHASLFAEQMTRAGYPPLNDVRLNQVLISFGSAERTQRIIAAVQRQGTCWCGGTVWQGKTAMRISVSGWATKDEDVTRSAAAILEIVQRES